MLIIAEFRSVEPGACSISVNQIRLYSYPRQFELLLALR